MGICNGNFLQFSIRNIFSVDNPLLLPRLTHSAFSCKVKQFNVDVVRGTQHVVPIRYAWIHQGVMDS